MRIPLRATRLHNLTRPSDEKKADSKDEEKIVGSWSFYLFGAAVIVLS